jgi:enoyl-CoA hydratase/carnithine racemase
VFCAGLADRVDPHVVRRRGDPVAALAAITKPVVAAVRGRAVGLGAELALAADLRVASRDAGFEFPDVSQGRVPCFGATQRLPRLVGRARALEMVLCGARTTAVAAAKLGLVSRLVTSGRLDEAVRELVAQLGRQGPLALVLAKEAVRRAGDLTLADGLRLEEDLYVLLQTTDDRREGIRSFLEKRPPRFRGR